MRSSSAFVAPSSTVYALTQLQDTLLKIDLSKSLSDFCEHPIAKFCGLTDAEVFVLRYYTTAGFKGINWPLRDKGRRERAEPHLLAVLVFTLTTAIKKLRAWAEARPHGSSTYLPKKAGVRWLSIASVAASVGFEWPPPAPASERQAERDAALERRVRAKMRLFLYSETEGGPGATEGPGAPREDGILTEGGGEGEGGVAKNARGSAPGVFGTLRRVSRPATAVTGGGGFERRREPRNTPEGTTAAEEEARDARAAEDEARDARAAFDESSDGSGAGGGGSEESESFYSDDFDEVGDLEDLFASCAEDFEPEEPCP